VPTVSLHRVLIWLQVVAFNQFLQTSESIFVLYQ